MEETGRKNTAGGWLRREILGRVTSAGMLVMVITGFMVGFLIRGLPMLDVLDRNLAAWGMLGVVSLVCGALYLFIGRVESTTGTWNRGWEAERRVGDLIEHAVVQPGCAFAHDVKEAIGGSGNIDHVVMIPLGVWVVETKSGWLSKRRFPKALRQAAGNARRVSRHLETALPVRGALVIDGGENGSFEGDFDWKGEPVKVFGAQAFWRVLRSEREQGTTSGSASEMARVETVVWDLGSSRHRDS